MKTLSTNARQQKLLWTLALLFSVLFIAAGSMPILDYAKRESLA